MGKDYLEIKNIELWSKVGVLDKERRYGQLFTLDVFLFGDFSRCSESDDLSQTIDYSILINDIKEFSTIFSCFTIEKFSEEILKIIKKKFKPVQIKIKLTKCNPPIAGFKGQVSIIKFYKK